MNTIPGRCGVVILAAGASTRMGRPKQLLPYGDQTLLEHAVTAALGSSLWPVVVVLGANAPLIRPVLARHPVLIADNPAWPEGMASSLRTGLGVLNAFSVHMDAALFTLCDQPALSAEIINLFPAARVQSGRSIVAARYDGHLGAPALFSREHFAALGALTGDEGARQLIAAAPPESVEPLDLPELGVDVDTPDDYDGLPGR